MTTSGKDLPSIKQILCAADSISDAPLTPEMARNWFKRTTESNKREREDREQKQRTAER